MAEGSAEANPIGWDASVIEAKIDAHLISALEHVAGAAVLAYLIGEPLELAGDARVMANIIRILGVPTVEIVEDAPALRGEIDTIPPQADNLHRRTNSGLIGVPNTDDEHKVQLSDETEVVDDSRPDFVVDQDKLGELAKKYGLRPRHTRLLEDILAHYGGGEWFSRGEAFDTSRTDETLGAFKKTYAPLVKVCIARGIIEYNGRLTRGSQHRVVTEVARELGLIIQLSGVDAIDATEENTAPGSKVAYSET